LNFEREKEEGNERIGEKCFEDGKERRREAGRRK